MSDSIYRFNVGQFECLVLKDGGDAHPLKTFMPHIPDDEIEQVTRSLGLDPAAIDFSVTILVVNADGHLVLVDTGVGKSGLPDKLKAEGVDPADIDLVVVTHGHMDHVGGIVDAAGNFVYPNARYVVGETEFDFWTAPEQVAQGDKNPAIAVWQTLQAHQDRITFIGSQNEEANVLPGICAIAAPGHTPGHMALSFESGEDRLLHIVDAAHSIVQITRTDWSPGFDTDKEQSARTRRKLFERAARDAQRNVP